MTKSDFIFSQKVQHRIARHGLFWLVFACYIFLVRYYVFDLKYLTYASTYLIRLQNLSLFFPVSVFYAYFGIHILLPRYILKERYAQLLLILVFLSAGLVVISYWISTQVNIQLAFDLPLSRSSFIRQVDFIASNGFVYPLTVSTFAIGIKMAKNFYLEQKQNELLAKQKISAEVQLSKSQVHPRFLFHSLKSIYHKMQNGSEQSPGMLLKLSDLLSYILYESDGKHVSLEKELNLMKNYFELEKENWGGALRINTGNEIETQDKFIAPLLLLPLAEYLFEKAEQNHSEELALSLNMLMKENQFWFILTMAGYADANKNTLHGNIQVEQVQKRLGILYPGRNHFKLEIHDSTIHISLCISLSEVN